GRPGMLDGTPRRGAGAAVMAGNGDVVGLRLRHARGDRADADLGNELHRDRRFRVGVLEIVDELRQILDRIDVVVRRRADQLDARRRIAQLGDVLRDLATRQLAALAGLRALRHLDLDLLGACQVFGGDTETTGGHLLDLGLQHVAFANRVVDFNSSRSKARAQRLAGLHRSVAPAILAALAGVRLATDAVHGDRERGVRFGRNRAERHRAGREALDDLGRGLDFLERHRLDGVAAELEQAAERHVARRLVVDDLRVLL